MFPLLELLPLNMHVSIYKVYILDQKFEAEISM